MQIKSDKELISRCVEGSPEAWDLFIDKFSGLVYWALKRKINRFCSVYSNSDLDDLHQHFFMSLWEKQTLRTVENRDNISPWLIVLASNLAIDFLRKKKREDGFLQEKLAKETPPDNNCHLPFINEKEDIFKNAMEILSEKERAYLKLVYFSGKKHKEIADIFDIPINSVSTVISRAKTKIRQFISKKYGQKL